MLNQSAATSVPRGLSGEAGPLLSGVGAPFSLMNLPGHLSLLTQPQLGRHKQKEHLGAGGRYELSPTELQQVEIEVRLGN